MNDIDVVADTDAVDAIASAAPDTSTVTFGLFALPIFNRFNSFAGC